MYKVKPSEECEMIEDMPLKALVLNASLKHKGKEISNTEELAQLVLDNMKPHKVESEIIRLADLRIPVGLDYKESDDDEWPSIVAKIKAADIVIFATPIWWGGRSSLMQRIIERLDSLDEEYSASGRSALLNKVAGICITGSEDGAQAVQGAIMEVLTWMNFTLPPECCAYWVGEVGQPPAKDREKRLANEATKHMAHNLARNLVYYAQLLKKHPMVMK
ncbi:MAG: NAD(P)H-dependent oxidoreductase [Candidatus Doudnabacteria bacterium]